MADLGDGLAIRIASIDDLIAMKRAAGRPQDVRDIATLTHIERDAAMVEGAGRGPTHVH